MEWYDDYDEDNFEDDFQEQPIVEDDKLEDKLINAEIILEKLRFYCDFHGLNFLTSTNCLSNMIRLL